MNSLILILMLVFHLDATTTFATPVLSQSQAAMKDVNLMVYTCKQTPNFQLCFSTLRSNPRSSAADTTGLALILVDAVKYKVTRTVDRIKQLGRSSPAMKKRLAECSEVYSAVLKADIPEAVEALTKGNPKFAENGIADTSVEADSCERSFRSSNSPLSDMNKAVNDIAVVTRSVIRQLL